MAKAYVQRFGDSYNNVIYLNGQDLFDENSSLTIKEMVLRMTFNSDRPSENNAQRFSHHDAILQSLKADSLLIIDDYNPIEEDSYLERLLDYPLTVLVVRREAISNYPHMEVKPFDAP